MDHFIGTYECKIDVKGRILIPSAIKKQISISTKDFTDVWMDLRISIFAQYILKSSDVINENLTYYRKTSTNVSSKFRKFSRSWWKRRRQAHEYFYKFSKDNKLNFKKNFDFVITELICKIL